MDQELLERITAEVMDSLKMSEAESGTAKRYVKRAVNRILLFCNREDFPEPLEDIAAQIAEDMLKADLVKPSEKEVKSISRGDTSISYKDDSATTKQAVDFMKDYERTLIRYKKPNLPKDRKNE